MPRRRELADVADGITGHFVFDSPANPDWPLAHVSFAVRAGHGVAYSFDLLDGTVEPPAKEVESVAHFLRGDFTRHLAVRRIDPAWVSAASLSVSTEGASHGTRVLVRCKVLIRDDRGFVHTSTRRGSMEVPRWGIGQRLSLWLRRNFAA